MRKSIYIISGVILSVFLVANTFAAQPLTCQQFAQTAWKDNTDSQLGGVSLLFFGASDGDNGWAITSNLEYYGGNFSFGSYQAKCSTQTDGSIKMVLAYQDYEDDGYLTLQPSGANMLKVLPGSYLVNDLGQHSAVQGPFLRK